MIDRSTTRRPIAAFTIPGAQPEAVADAQAEFDRIADDYGALLGRIEDTKAAAKQARADDGRRLVESTLAGEPDPKDTGKAEAKLQAQLEADEFKLAQVEKAVDIAGNALAEAIGEAQADWIAALEAQRDGLVGRYTAAISEAQAVADELAKANGALTWLRDFDTGEAIVGRVQGWHGGGRLDVVSNDGPLRGEYQAGLLLTLAARAVEPPVVRGPEGRSRVVAGGGSFR